MCLGNKPKDGGDAEVRPSLQAILLTLLLDVHTLKLKGLGSTRSKERSHTGKVYSEVWEHLIWISSRLTAGPTSTERKHFSER